MTQSGCLSTLKDLFNSKHWYENIFAQTETNIYIQYFQTLSSFRATPLQKLQFSSWCSCVRYILTTSYRNTGFRRNVGFSSQEYSHHENTFEDESPCRRTGKTNKTTTFDFPLRFAVKCDESQRLLWARSQMRLAESTSLFCWLPSYPAYHPYTTQDANCSVCLNSSSKVQHFSCISWASSANGFCSLVMSFS